MPSSSTASAQDEHAGLWSWSKFLFALGFAALEFAVLVVPLTFVDSHAHYFPFVVTIASIVAALNFIWFIIVCRCWRLPTGETILQAYRDEHPKQP